MNFSSPVEESVARKCICRTHRLKTVPQGTKLWRLGDEVPPGTFKAQIIKQDIYENFLINILRITEGEFAGKTETHKYFI